MIVSYYCNVALLSVFNVNVLSFVDLDLALVKELDREWKVSVVEELKMNCSKYHYPSKLVEASVHPLDTL